MTKKELESKLLIQPKELEVLEGNYTQKKGAAVYTNANTDISFLLGMAGFDGEVKAVEVKDLFVLSVGKEPALDKDYFFANDEAYYLSVGADTVEIVGGTLEGMLMGLKAFIRMSGEVEVLPQMEVMDYPNVSFRSVHVCMFRPDDGTEKEESSPEYIKKMMRHAAICGYNYVIIEFWGMFPYSMDYAHWPNAYTRADIEDLVSYGMDKLHIRPLPDQNLTGHAGWSRIVSRKHVVLDQRPDLGFMYIPGGWCFATEIPETQEFIKTCIDELLEVFRNPPYLHAGCDKTFGFGSTEEDRMFSADVLFAKHITFLSSYLARKNTRMIMWADMLYSSMDALYWKCDPKTTDYLPKNIVMNVWTHENPGEGWRDPEFFEDRDFDTVYSPWMNEDGIKAMVDLCNERGSKGIVQTTWHKPETASWFVGMSGAIQWCGQKPAAELVKAQQEKWYLAAL